MHDIDVDCYDPLMYQCIRRGVSELLMDYCHRTFVEWHLVMSFVVTNDETVSNKLTIEFLSAPRTLWYISDICKQFDLAYNDIICRVDEYESSWDLHAIDRVTVHIAEIL